MLARTPGPSGQTAPRAEPDAPTITKRRYMWEPHLVKMFEVAVLEDTPLPAPLEDELLRYLDGALPTTRQRLESRRKDG